MQDFTKFKLKNDIELRTLLSGIDNLLILSCNKCFKRFNADSMPEPESAELIRLAEELGKNVCVSLKFDFLCNEHRLHRILTKLNEQCKPITPQGIRASLICICCGIGSQTIASKMLEINPAVRVYTACDSIETGTGHGMSLSDKLCNACGQCFLNSTAGICPISGCAKKLLNGPCGGAKDGKCETDTSKVCVWDEIYLKTALQQSKNYDGHSNIFDYNRYKSCNINGFTLDEISRRSRQRRSESFYGGLYLKYCKDSTAFLTLQEFELPQKVVIPMSQHAGMSAEPIICVGDHVKVGQKIGEATGAISSCVHASISGVVTSIDMRSHPNMIYGATCITIESDGKNELHGSVLPIPYWDDLDIYDIDAIIAEKGIVGMGGAGFPTPVKLNAPKPIDTILLNGCESEPYITADHRIMLEKADDIITGLRIVMKSTGAQRGIIVISDNKSDAIAHLEKKTADFDDIFVMALWSKYPQGAERMLIARTLGRHLAYGQRPYDLGATVINVSTARAIGDAFLRGMPLIERAVTISGKYIKNPGNYLIRIGTPVSNLLEHCGIQYNICNNIYNEKKICVKLGGPMMGADVSDLSVPVIKGTNAIIAIDAPLTSSGDCIRCGRCVDVCPMELLPLYMHEGVTDDMINNFYVNQCKNIAGLHNYDVCGSSVSYYEEFCEEINPANCIECGACDYICPSAIKIRDCIRAKKRKSSGK